MSTDLKYRFDEIMTSVHLLPDDPDDDANPRDFVLPNLTRDMRESELYTAVLCQAFKTAKDDDLFASKLSFVMVNSVVASVNEKEGKVSEDDLMALSVAVNLTWAEGASCTLFKILGLLADIMHNYSHDNEELILPDQLLAIFRPSRGASELGKLDPYKLLAKSYSPEEVFEITLGEEGKKIAQKLMKKANKKK